MKHTIITHMLQSSTKIDIILLLVLSIATAAIVFVGPTSAQAVTTDEIVAGGSTVEIETEGVASISITDIEGSVSNIQHGSKTDAGILFSNLSGLPQTVSFDLSPRPGADSVNFEINGDLVEVNVSRYNVNVTTTKVAADGSTVTLETDGAASISVTNIEGEVANVKAGSKTDAGILFSDLGGLPETVSFDLTPLGKRDTTSFDLDGETIELNVTERKFADNDFNRTQYIAVFGDDNTQSQDEISSAVNKWSANGGDSLGSVHMSQDDLSSIINYWFKNN